MSSGEPAPPLATTGTLTALAHRTPSSPGRSPPLVPSAFITLSTISPAPRPLGLPRPPQNINARAHAPAVDKDFPHFLPGDALVVHPGAAGNRFQELAVNPDDAAAHYLLGTLLFSKGMADAGVAEWTEAKQLAPHLRVIDVDMGDFFLRLKGDPQRALVSFREAMKNDPDNAEAYVGLDEAMSLTGDPATERAGLLSNTLRPTLPIPGCRWISSISLH